MAKVASEERKGTREREVLPPREHCRHCQKDWQPRSWDVQACPKCGSRFWYSDNRLPRLYS